MSADLKKGVSAPKEERLQKQAYLTQIYAMRAWTADKKWLMAYLVDRMYPYASEPRKKLYRGEVMPGFLSVNKVHAETGLHEDTIRKRLLSLTNGGMIMPFGFVVNAGKYHRQFRLDTILLAPPDQLWSYTSIDLYKRMLADDLTSDSDEYSKLLKSYRGQLSDWLDAEK